MGKPFYIKDCALITSMGGVEPAMNLRELRDRITICPVECIYHHFCETVLRPTFDDPEFRNDFAVWASRELRDRTLAERLGALNPYLSHDFEQLREEVLARIDDRLNEMTMIPWSHRGAEFRFMKAVTVVFDTDIVLSSPGDLSKAISGMTLSSIYFHFVAANLRPPKNIDDFSNWLSEFGDETVSIIDALKGIDCYYPTLAELRKDLITVFSKYGGNTDDR